MSRPIPPIDSRIRPTPEQWKRAKVADRLFELHAELNKLIGGIALQIIDGADVEAALVIMKHNHTAIFSAAMQDAERIQKEERL
jgi:hypothetical protein